MKQKGFLRYDPIRDHYRIDWRKTLSILVGELLLDEVLAVREYMSGRLLDVGCGERPYVLIYEDRVELSIGTEVKNSLHGTSEADVICYAEHLPFISECFDFILCTEVLEHARQPFRVLREFSRLLKPGGYVFVSVPFIYPIHEAPIDHWRFTAHGLELACQYAGLKPLYVRPKGGPLVALMSLWTHLMIRMVNGTGKMLNVSRPLYEQTWIRWLMALPQWVYLGLGRKLLWKTNWADKSKEKFSTLFRRPNWLNEVNAWMTAGYVLLAQKPVNPATFFGIDDETITQS